MKPELLLSFDQEVALGAGALAGMDEAGRGPLAGPVAAACVMLPLDAPIAGINDSKKLSEVRREKLYDQIMSRATAVGVALVQAEDIDRVNILQATRLAMTQAYGAMGARPELLLTDAMERLDVDAPIRAMIKGDATSYHIAAASIVAKVTRDRLMAQYEEQWPQYGFARHKGYGTAEHIAALREHGPCPEHRRSFIGGILGPDRREKGAFGEDMAEKYLASCGMEVLSRNWRDGPHELDLVARDGAVTVFVEVKYREGSRFGTPAEAVDARKRLSLTRAARAWLALKSAVRCRFDVVEVERRGRDLAVNHIKNAFPAQEDIFL